jgi:hypothetical protein
MNRASFVLAGLISMFLFLNMAFGQTPGMPVKITKGIKAGLNSSKFTGDDVSDLKSKSGFIGGVFVRVGVLGIVAVQPELLYTQKGAKIDSASTKITYNVNYLEIPLLVRVDIPFVIVRPFLYGGPTLGFKLSAKTKTEQNGQTNEADINEAKSSDTGIALGVGADLNVLGFGSIVVDLRYTKGLSSFVDPGNVKNEVFSAMVGISL